MKRILEPDTPQWEAAKRYCLNPSASNWPDPVPSILKKYRIGEDEEKYLRLLVELRIGVFSKKVKPDFAKGLVEEGEKEAFETMKLALAIDLRRAPSELMEKARRQSQTSIF